MDLSLRTEARIGSYKRQMEVYQWLFRKNGFEVSPTGYFVYCNGKLDRESFDAKLEFDIDLIPYKGDDAWVEKALKDIKECLMAEKPPKPASACDYCAYRKAARDVQAENQAESKKKTKPLL